MSLTPIKVRGKRSSVQTESSRLPINFLLNPYPRDQRPVSGPPAKSPRHSHVRSKNVGRRARFASPLEQLPTELLETIFLYNLNLSLPQASPIIGSKLATKHVKNKLVLHICSAGSQNIYPSEQAALFPSVRDHAEAQSAILRLKWMTLTFVRQLMSDYIVKTVVRELRERGLQWLGEGPVVTEETGSMIRKYIEETATHLKTERIDDLPMFGRVKWRNDNPSRLIRLSFSLHDGMVMIEEQRVHGLEVGIPERHQWRIFCGLNGCAIPEKLLHEPWTPEKCDFLEMLIRGNATVNWVGTTSGEIAEKGLMQALRAGNARATRLLVSRAGLGTSQGLWAPPCPSNGNDFQTLDSEPWPRAEMFQAWTSDMRGVGVVPQTKHLRMAVLEAGCQQDVVEALLAAKDTSIDFDDRAILEWAIEREVRGDKRGWWLLSKLCSYGTDL